MPVLNTSFSGSAIALHARAINELIAANEVKSVLEIGVKAARPRLAGGPDVLWYGHKTAAGVLDTVKELPGPYDLVIACGWLNTFTVEALPDAIKELWRLTEKVLFVYEDETNPRKDTKRPLGWDRVDWTSTIGARMNKRTVFSMTAPSIDGTQQLLSYMITQPNSGTWQLHDF